MTDKQKRLIEFSHFGNIANNGYFNSVLLGEFPEFISTPVTNWTRHAMSDPSWEELSFEIPNMEFIDNPDWDLIPGAQDFRKGALAKAIEPQSEVLEAEVRLSSTLTLRKLLAFMLRGIVWSAKKLRFSPTFRAFIWREALKPIADAIYVALEPRKVEKSIIDSGARTNFDRIQILYGAPDYAVIDRQNSHLILLEHGTLRWIRVGSRVDSKSRQRYSDLVESCDHLWVTNLDTATTDIAEELAYGKWSAFPHPYRLHGIEFNKSDLESRNSNLRVQLEKKLNSDFIICLPSSINWLPDHDKGSLKAIEAFIALRKQGVSVGLVCVEWGRQVSQAKKKFHDSGVENYVAWMKPMPRIQLQSLIKECDVVWDQFGAPGFGALAIKTMEAGVPLITHGISEFAENLIGEAPKWLSADTVDNLVSQTVRLVTETGLLGRNEVRSEYGEPGRDWLYRRHHHEITKFLQWRRYQSMLGNLGNASARPDDWSRVPDYGSEAWSSLIEKTGYRKAQKD